MSYEIMPRAIFKEQGKDLQPEIDEYRVSSMAQAVQVAMRRSRELEEAGLTDPDPDPYGYMQELEDQFGLNLLDPQWKSKPGDAKWVVRLKARARKAAIAKLFLMGKKVPEIAMRCKVSESTVLYDLQLIEQEWRKSYMEDTEAIAAKDMERLEYYLMKLAPAIERGDVKAINAAVDVIKERGNITGYRHGVQVDIETYIREIAASEGYDPDKAVQIASRISYRLNK